MNNTLDAEECYRALASHDTRFDGRFYVGVTSTGIYCRPICKVRLPLQKNCTFHASAALAESAGFRPCLRCRPELAPGLARSEMSVSLAVAAEHLIDKTLHLGENLTEISKRLGVSDRHMRRLFETEFGVQPIEYLQTRRLLLAKRLLTDTSMSVTQVAEATGFKSIRRLNSSMQERYKLNPTELRQKSRPSSASKTRSKKPDSKTKAANSELPLRLTLPLRQPYDLPWMFNFLESRAISTLETCTPESYSRVLAINTPNGIVHGWIRLQGKARQEKDPHAQKTRDNKKTKSNATYYDAVHLDVSSELVPYIAPVLTSVRHILDLDTEPHSFLPILGDIAASNPGIRLPGCASGFEIAVRAVLGQQITVKAARTLAVRFVNRFGAPCKFSGENELAVAFPEPAKISRVRDSSIAELGIISRRAKTIKLLAREINTGQLDLSPGAPVESTLKQLNDLPGIGDWTAQYIAMRALRWPDAFPAADYGVMKALDVKTPAQARKACEHWKPWRAYAVMHLWASLSA